MKYKIEKNTVQETLIIPLYARKVCSELYPNLYQDETAVRLINEIDYDFSEAEKNSRGLMQRFGSLEVAMRQNDLAFEVRDYLKGHPNAAVINLGCGLDGTGRSCDNGSCKIYNLDYPDVIAVRNELLPAGEREENIPCDLNDTAWFSQIDASGGAVFFASGVFYYFLTEQVKALMQAMADAFPGGALVFDAANRTAVKMIAKTWLKSAKIKDVGAFSINGSSHLTLLLSVPILRKRIPMSISLRRKKWKTRSICTICAPARPSGPICIIWTPSVTRRFGNS